MDFWVNIPHVNGVSNKHWRIFYVHRIFHHTCLDPGGSSAASPRGIHQSASCLGSKRPQDYKLDLAKRFVMLVTVQNYFLAVTSAILCLSL